MLETLEHARSSTLSYIGFLESAMSAVPNANPRQIAAFRASIERQLSANHEFAGKLLRAEDFGEVMHLQLEYFKSLTASAAEDANRVSAELYRPRSAA